jgi:alpha-D-ribose 1-methylphosphonate 5-triphosphate synthase subunit PhnH
MSADLTHAQRKAIFAIYERCSAIKELAELLRREAEGSAEEQMAGTDLLEQREELKGEVKFALGVGVPANRMNAVREAALPPEYHADFTLPEPQAA